MITCPGLAELALIGRGEDAGSCTTGFAAHIEECPRCRELLERSVQNGLGISHSPGTELIEKDVLPAIDGFMIDRELGRGAMGVVYLAHRDLPRRQVALKLLPGGRRANPGERRQWLREAHAASLVRHPNIVTVYEAAETERWFVMAMEYIPGGTLADRLSRPVGPRIAARLMEAVADAVHQIHQSGQLHLDLKPSNILLDGDPGSTLDAMIPKVSDFGIARSAEPGATDTGQASPGGTPSYMAPEQITKSRKEMTIQADIHGLGAILYHMLTGRPPYQGATVLETIDQVQRLDPVRPRQFSSAIPRDLETICLKCLHKDPSRRYASAKALADDLRLWLDGRPISARPVPALEKTVLWCRRRPVVAGLVATLLLTVSGTFAAVTVLWRQAEQNLRMSEEIINDFVVLITDSYQAFPRGVTPERLIPMLERHRNHVLTVAGNLTDSRSVARQLTHADLLLSYHLIRVGRLHDARVVLRDRLGRVDDLVRRHPSDSALREYLCRCLRALAEVNEQLGEHEDQIILRMRLIRLCEEGIGLAPGAGVLATLLEARRDLVWLLYSRGDLEQARSLVTANQRTLTNIPVECQGLSFKVQFLLSRIDSSMLLAANPVPLSTTGTRESVDSSPLSEVASPTDAAQSPEQWARLAALALRRGDLDARAAGRSQAEDTMMVLNSLTSIASFLRQTQNLEGARRLGERMHSLAKLIVADQPNEPAAYLALSTAFRQLYKNAYRENDRTAIEANMNLAIDAARKALLLDPKSESASNAVDDLQRRLADLRSGHY